MIGQSVPEPFLEIHATGFHAPRPHDLFGIAHGHRYQHIEYPPPVEGISVCGNDAGALRKQPGAGIGIGVFRLEIDQGFAADIRNPDAAVLYSALGAVLRGKAPGIDRAGAVQNRCDAMPHPASEYAVYPAIAGKTGHAPEYPGKCGYMVTGFP